MSFKTWIEYRLRQTIQKIGTDIKSLKDSKQDELTWRDNISLSLLGLPLRILSAVDTTYEIGTVEDILNGDDTEAKRWSGETIIQALREITANKTSDTYKRNTNAPIPWGSHKIAFSTPMSSSDPRNVFDNITFRSGAYIAVDEPDYYNVILDIEVDNYSKPYGISLNIDTSNYKIASMEYTGDRNVLSISRLFYETGPIYLQPTTNVSVEIENNLSPGNLTIKESYITITRLQ